MMELIQGEGGVLPLDKDYVQAVARAVPGEGLAAAGGRGPDRRRPDRQPVCLPAVRHSARCGRPSPKASPADCRMGGILADEKCRDVLTPGTHGTTFGGQPRLRRRRRWRSWHTLDDAFPSRGAGEGRRICEPALRPGHAPAVGGVRRHGPDAGRGRDRGPHSTRSWHTLLLDKGLLCLTAGDAPASAAPAGHHQRRNGSRALPFMKQTLDVAGKVRKENNCHEKASAEAAGPEPARIFCEILDLADQLKV